MPLIPFPNVPDVPGVPAVPRSPSVQTVQSAAAALVQNAIWSVLQNGSQWGIYDSNGRPLGDPSKLSGVAKGAIRSTGVGATLSTNTVNYRKSMQTSDFPVQEGGFASYNKVEKPAAPIVSLCFSGSESERATFLSSIEAATKSTDLYSVTTPEVTYINYSIEEYSYERTQSRGATLLRVDIYLKEIRQVSATYSQSTKTPINNPKNAGATPAADGGKVQAQAPRQSVLKSLSSKLGL